MKRLLAFTLLLASPLLAQRTPINDLGSARYLGFQGGLYEQGANHPPADHATAGLSAASRIVPRDQSGNPSPQGKIAFLSIGMSNTTQEFCAASGPVCASWSFVGQALADPAVDKKTLVLVNGAMGGQAADVWDSASEPNYNRIRDTVLARDGLTEAQVQAAWVKVANRQPSVALPAADSDAWRLVRQMGDITRSLKTRYPNLQIVYLSSRIYAGYATTTLNPEPYAYESGFAVKWLIQAQIDQMRNGGMLVEPRAGDLHYATTPWLAWGAYLWADGMNPRSDGLVWTRSDLASDGTHPSRSGEEKVGALLLAFLKSDPTAKSWFLSSHRQMRRRAIAR
jgi:hypothetical protein